MQINLLQVAKFAQWVHRNDTRKDKRTPYITHPARVAGRVILLDEASDQLVAAAWLHDTYEDHPNECPIDLIQSLFGYEVAQAVSALTNEYTKEKHPGLSRVERKSRECKRIKDLPRDVKLIKLADRLDNLGELDPIADTDFAQLYVNETAQLFEALRDTEHPMLQELKARMYALQRALDTASNGPITERISR